LAITHRAQILKGLLERRGWRLVSSPGQLTDHCFTEVFPNLTMGVLEPGRSDRARRWDFVQRLFHGGYNDISLGNDTVFALHPHI